MIEFLQKEMFSSIVIPKISYLNIFFSSLA